MVLDLEDCSSPAADVVHILDSCGVADAVLVARLLTQHHTCNLDLVLTRGGLGQHCDCDDALSCLRDVEVEEVELGVALHTVAIQNRGVASAPADTLHLGLAHVLIRLEVADLHGDPHVGGTPSVGVNLERDGVAWCQPHVALLPLGPLCYELKAPAVLHQLLQRVIVHAHRGGGHDVAGVHGLRQGLSELHGVRVPRGPQQQVHGGLLHQPHRQVSHDLVAQVRGVYVVYLPHDLVEGKCRVLVKCGEPVGCAPEAEPLHVVVLRQRPVHVL
mmetsp:Transcript_3872/g.8306  ORF Transcript_3872/g.8306 Transcript_3872/m.8306 type:complete len:273 (+) Transcript_3872:855-1673(+)